MAQGVWRGVARQHMGATWLCWGRSDVAHPKCAASQAWLCNYVLTYVQTYLKAASRKRLTELNALASVYTQAELCGETNDPW